MEDINNTAPATATPHPDAMSQMVDMISHLNHRLDQMETRNRTPTELLAPEIPTANTPSNTRVLTLPSSLKQPKVQTPDLYFGDRKKLRGFLTQLDIYFTLRIWQIFCRPTEDLFGCKLPTWCCGQLDGTPSQKAICRNNSRHLCPSSGHLSTFSPRDQPDLWGYQ